MIWLLRLVLVKNFTCSYKKADFSVIVNIKYLHVCMFYFFHFFKIIIVHLFLARHDQHFIMFINSNVFEFANFPFKRKYNNTAVYSGNSNYLFSWGNKKKNCWNDSLIKCTVYLIIFPQNSTIFKGSPKSLKESYITRKLRLGES